MTPNGTYKARATEGALGRTSAGKPQVAVAFTITEGEHAGSVVPWNGYFTEKTEERTLESLRHCGWNTDDLSNLAGISDNEVSIVVEVEDFETDTGEIRQASKVRWVNASGGGLRMKERMDDADAARFAQQMKAKVLAQKQKMQGKASATKPANGTKPASSARGASTDDPSWDPDRIPF